jgi:rod shape-determining protein MreC
LNDRSIVRWLALVVVIITLLNLPASVSGTIKSAIREAVRPVQHAVHSLFTETGDYLRSIGRIPRLLAENAELQQRVDRLAAERASLRLLEAENEALRRQLGMRPRPEQDWISAEVLARSRDGWWQTMYLDKGSDDGIANNMPVISVDGLVGKTVMVTRNTAEVLLISDPVFKVSTRITRTGSFGVVSGRGPSWRGQVFCRMEFIHKDDDVRSGDEVVTSGLGGAFPENLPVGYIDRVRTDLSGLYQQADIITRADLSRLRHVFVLRSSGASGGGR